MPLDSSNFVGMHLFPDSSGLFSKRCTLGAELLLWWQTNLFLHDPLHNVVSEIYWDLISIHCCVFFRDPLSTRVLGFLRRCSRVILIPFPFRNFHNSLLTWFIF